jgi:hypothetical protein
MGSVGGRRPFGAVTVGLDPVCSVGRIDDDNGDAVKLKHPGSRWTPRGQQDAGRWKRQRTEMARLVDQPRTRY